MRSVLILLLLPYFSFSQLRVSSTAENEKSYFSIVTNSEVADVYVAPSESYLVRKSADFLVSDVEKVAGKKPVLISSEDQFRKKVILVGSIGNSPMIDELISSKRLDVDLISDQWERFVIQTVDKPFDGVDEALVIVGSDRRGVAYGVFSLSEQIGVSPWYWWADVPIKKRDNLFIEKSRFVSIGPAVKYRGIFINDESPALRYWAKEKFGDLNHTFYEKVFELLLRNKANYLWPAMWLPTIFNEDDPLNPKVADDYGIVISTSHHEPMMRSHNEWNKFGGGEWNYETNREKLQEFWKGGIERMGDFESVVTVGMRGDGDEGMSEETAVDLLKTIIRDQRQIMEEVSGKPANETPQVWAVYKEVQDYYDKGLRVDDDIIVLFCDDNWGNLRILPKKEDLDRQAGYGIYYHFDYVGAPVSYRWLNTTQIERTWEQMNLAYKHGVKDLWLVNVGDIKPMELPISFFLDYAWNPDAIQAKDLPAYYVNWSKQQFGNEYAEEIADLLSKYTKYNSRRTPEMIRPDTYSIENYREADRIVEEYNQLLSKSAQIFEQLPEDHKSAFYQLVHSPIAICANLNEMYVSAGKNKYYGERGAASANFYADKVKELFERDAELARYYHEELENGKWNHMMSQTHIGYTFWDHPPIDMMPAVSYVRTKKQAELGYLLEYGKTPRWGWLDVEGDWSFSTEFLPFDPFNNQQYYLEIINRGEETLNYSLKAEDDWIKFSRNEGSIQYAEKVYVSIDWSKAPKGKTTGAITVMGAGKEYSIKVPIRNDLSQESGFIENNGVIAFEAVHFTRKNDTRNIYWTEVPNLGRTGSAMIIEPVNIARQNPQKDTPMLEYDFSVFTEGEVAIHTYLSPTQDFRKGDGLHYAIAVDDEEPQIINMNEGEIKPDYEYAGWWTKSVGDHIKIKESSHKIDKAGKHTLKIWVIDPGIAFQKFVIDVGGLRSSYLGPPESVYLGPNESGKSN